jgi:hypothetical protein
MMDRNTRGANDQNAHEHTEMDAHEEHVEIWLGGTGMPPLFVFSFIDGRATENTRLPALLAHDAMHHASRAHRGRGERTGRRRYMHARHAVRPRRAAAQDKFLAQPRSAYSTERENRITRR